MLTIYKLPITVLQACGDVGAVDNQESTPLHEAARGGHFSCVILLCLYGADVNTADIVSMSHRISYFN